MSEELVLKLQAGAGSLDGSVDPKLGIVALKIKCWAPTLLCAIVGTLPDGIDIGLVESQPRTFSRRTGGDQDGYDVNVTLEGHTDPPNADGEDYGLEGATSEDPIEAHPDYQLLLDAYDGSEDAGTGKAKWPKTMGENDVRNPMHGVESYLVPGVTWTRKWTSQALGVSLVRGLGTIEQPPGNPPELSGGRNWLKVRARATRRGNVWQIEESWLLSGPEGWVEEMYRQS